MDIQKELEKKIHKALSLGAHEGNELLREVETRSKQQVPQSEWRKALIELERTLVIERIVTRDEDEDKILTVVFKLRDKDAGKQGAHHVVAQTAA